MAVLSLGTDPQEAVDIINHHNHTGGNGVPIPTDGIENGAITTEKLAHGAVTTEELAHGAVTPETLAAELVQLINSGGSGGAAAPAYFRRLALVPRLARPGAQVAWAVHLPSLGTAPAASNPSPASAGASESQPSRQRQAMRVSRRTVRAVYSPARRSRQHEALCRSPARFARCGCLGRSPSSSSCCRLVPAAAVPASVAPSAPAAFACLVRAIAS